MSAGERIIDIDVVDEMRSSFLEYSYSVIYSRALPDVRDGLKPVQRRIVYQMGEMGLRPDRGHVKSARVTGEVMGKLHPHGDGAIYDALVRLAQPFTLRMPLIDGHGNFGSLDDGPAAARYTEVKLAAAAMLLNQSLEEQVVDFRPNYDAQLTEPEVLPAAFPNLLVNGATGIAVGMATNIPSHNLSEVVAALNLMITNPEVTLDEIMQALPAPDFPLGGLLLQTEGLRSAYETGRGAITVRARVQIDVSSSRRPGLLVTELPYLIGPERVIEKIKDLVASKRLTGIANVVDLTDRFSGLQLLIELKAGADPEQTLSELYSLTPLQENFNVNMVALVAGQPSQLSLLELLRHYLEHRYQVVVRRSRNRLEIKTSRLHLLDGLKVAVVNLDEVIRIIRQSETVDSARKALMSEFELTELQAEFILELRLRRLTRFSLIEIAKEAKELEFEIQELEELLQSDVAVRQLISRELSDIAARHGNPRRSELRDPSDSNWISETPHLETSSRGRIGLNREGSPVRVLGSDSANYRALELDSSPSWIGLTRLGEGVRLSHKSIVEGGISESFASLCPLIPQSEIFLVSADGKIKRSIAPSFKRSRQTLLRAPQGAVAIGISKSELVLFSNVGSALRFPTAEVPVQGLSASGVVGLNLAPGEEIVAAVSIDDDEAMQSELEVIVQLSSGTDEEWGLRSVRFALSSLQTSHRARRGVKLVELDQGESVWDARLVAPV